MKFLICRYIFGSFCGILCCAKFSESFLEPRNNFNLAKVVGEVIAQLFTQDTTTANLIVLNQSSNSMLKMDLNNEILTEVFANSKAIARYPTLNQLSHGEVQKFVVFLTNGHQELMEAFKSFSSGKLNINGFYLVVITGHEFTDSQEIFKIFWASQIYNVNIMFENASSVVEVITFVPFGAGNCDDTSPILLNCFEEGKFVNDVGNYFPDKLENLHNCPLRVAVLINSEPSVFVSRTPSGMLTLRGSDIRLVETLASTLNFNISYLLIEFNARYCEKLNSSNPSISTFIGSADMTVAYWFLKVNCLKTFDATTSYTSEKIVLIVPNGRSYSFFEKLFYPFQLSVWGMIVVCFFIGTLTIFFISRRSKSAQNFVFGAGVRNPYLNLFIGFIGGTLPALPRMNFARFLLMVLLLYCLVIRSIYQGSFFEFLRNSKHYKEVQSIDEMIAKDFRFYAQAGISELFLGSENIKNRLKPCLKLSQT